MQDVAALLPGIGWRILVDAQPLLERSLAARAGLGWIGKNTMLLDEEHGPWLLLAEVLLNVEVPPDIETPDRCGTCTACLDACPTGALDGLRSLDANKCLSYWTIEHRGELPEEWAAATGHRVFGCDDCLTACPFPSRPAALPSPGPFVPRNDLIDPDLDDLERRATEGFRHHFGSTPLERTRKGGLLRNITAVRAARP
jgi:epoxyqueuosine reductase